MKKKTQLQDFGYGTKPKKGLVLRGDVSYDNGAKYSGALKSVNKRIPHGYGLYFFPEHGQMKKFDGNITQMAKFIKMERSALYRKLKSVGVSED